MNTETHIDDWRAEVADSALPIGRKYNVDIREFVVLAVIYDSKTASTTALCAALELSSTTVEYCIDRLLENGLVRPSGSSRGDITTTFDGDLLVRSAMQKFVNTRERASDAPVNTAPGAAAAPITQWSPAAPVIAA